MCLCPIRCMIPVTISNITEWTVAPSYTTVEDACKVNMLNETIKCQKWWFNETYYESTRATQVTILKNTKCTYLK